MQWIDEKEGSVARTYQTSPCRVERAIRYAIEVAFHLLLRKTIPPYAVSGIRGLFICPGGLLLCMAGQGHPIFQAQVQPAQDGAAGQKPCGSEGKSQQAALGT